MNGFDWPSEKVSGAERDAWNFRARCGKDDEVFFKPGKTFIQILKDGK